MKFDKVAIALGAVVILMLAVIIVVQAGVFGISADRVEKNARKAHDIDDNWQVAQSEGDDICALLFYDDDKDEYLYSAFFTGADMTAGFFEGESGTEYPYMEEKAQAFVYEDKGIALVSLNHDKVAKIVTTNASGSREIKVSASKPFVEVLPLDCGEIKLLNEAGEVVTCYDTYK